jgi:hypothetical protein
MATNGLWCAAASDADYKMYPEHRRPSSGRTGRRANTRWCWRIRRLIDPLPLQVDLDLGASSTIGGGP